jgi:hypothetical protein
VYNQFIIKKITGSAEVSMSIFSVSIQSKLINFDRVCEHVFGREIAHGDASCCSLTDRAICLEEAVTDLADIVFAPFKAARECWKIPANSDGKVNGKTLYPSGGWKLLDGTLCVLLSSLLFLISMIKNLAGAILHPAIALEE